jgi:hypothetical protein
LYADRFPEIKQLLIRPLLHKAKNMNIAGIWNSHFPLWRQLNEQMHLDKLSLVQWKIIDIPTSFICIIIFYDQAFEYGNGGTIKLLRWMQNLYHSMWNNAILYADGSSKDKQLFYFIETTHEPQLSDKWSFKQWKIIDIPVSFIESSFYLMELLNMAMARKFEVMLEETLNNSV